MKYLFILSLWAVIACNKETIPVKQPQLSFDINGRHLVFDSASISAQPFCGQVIYSISAVRPGEVFLISIVDDSLQLKEYVAGFNYWYQGGSITSAEMHVTIDHNSAVFSSDIFNIRNGRINLQFK